MKKEKNKEEKKENRMLQFFYETAVGRIFLKIMVCPGVSKFAGMLLNSHISRWWIPGFVKKHGIDLGSGTLDDYQSFNDFFTRRRSSDKIDEDPENFISPCDGWLSVYPIDEKMVYRIKNTDYRLEDLLQDQNLAEAFAGGICMIFRLTPADYHRYSYPCDGIRTAYHRIYGKLHCVRPIAYRRVPVFIENTREYTTIHSPQFGQVLQMEVGALLVGKIHNYYKGRKAVRGREKGYFEFGGSTIIVLTEKNKVRIADSVLNNQNQDGEIRIRLGDTVGIPREGDESI